MICGQLIQWSVNGRSRCQTEGDHAAPVSLIFIDDDAVQCMTVSNDWSRYYVTRRHSSRVESRHNRATSQLRAALGSVGRLGFKPSHICTVIHFWLNISYSITLILAIEICHMLRWRCSCHWLRRYALMTSSNVWSSHIGQSAIFLTLTFFITMALYLALLALTSVIHHGIMEQ